MPPEQKPKTPEPTVKPAPPKTNGTPQPFRTQTPLPPEQSKSGETAVPTQVQPSESSGPTKPNPAASLDEAIVQAIDDNHETRPVDVASAANGHATVPISVEELRRRGLL